MARELLTSAAGDGRLETVLQEKAGAAKVCWGGVVGLLLACGLGMLRRVAGLFGDMVVLFGLGLSHFDGSFQGLSPPEPASKRLLPKKHYKPHCYTLLKATACKRCHLGTRLLAQLSSLLRRWSQLWPI